MADQEKGNQSVKQFVSYRVICERQEGEEKQLPYFTVWLFYGFTQMQFQPLVKTAETSVTQHILHHWMIVIMVLRDGDNQFPQSDRSVLAWL